MVGQLAMSEFADVRQGGHFVRHWAPWAGRRPPVEVRDSPEGFDPPFGSGEELQLVADIGVPVYARSREHYVKVAGEVLILKLEVR